MQLDQAAARGPGQPLRQIEQACMAASRVVSRLLDLSRGRQRGEKEIDLVHLVQEAMDFLRHTVPASIAFDLDLPGESIIVKAEPGILDEVLSNLVINARDALPQRGTIRVALRGLPEEERVRLVVEDDGPGIPPHLLSRIFESGFTTKGDRGGTGLGLAMVKRVLEEMGGEIKVRSELGRGTAFELFLPLVRGEGAALEHIPERGAPPRRGGGETVLVVDDEETVLTLLCDLLQHLGYNYLACSGAKEALGVFKARHREVDLVLVDHTMPEMSGRELAEEIKRLVPGMGVVLTSGYPPESMGRGPEDDFLAKPFDLDRVARVVAHRVRGRTSR
jgi:CheY-like chemotaxis protein